MPSFFAAQDGSSPIGRTVGCADPHTQGTSRFVSIKDVNIGWSTHRSIITRITMSMQGNFQFLHTIGNDIYVYAFGDRIGQISIFGLSMTRDCKSPGDTKHGFEKVYKWYQDNRIAKKKAPITISIGQDTTIEGFVVGLNADAVDPQTRVMQFAIQMAVFPKKR
jgi:hypothetical protein